MKKTVFIAILVFVAALTAGAQVISTRPFSIGETVEIRSAILDENRTLNIYLPDGYKDDTAHYPVIYLPDGSADEDFIHIAGLVQFMNLMYGMPKTIVAGIANVDRKRDFTFHTDLKELRRDFPTTGHSDRFIRFIEEELVPLMEKNYRTGGGRTIIGQSLGGLLATELLLKKPALFRNYIIVSPSLWWDKESLLKLAPRLLSIQPDNTRNICIFVGKEGKTMESDARALADAIRGAGKKNTQLHFLPLTRENHATILHQAVFEALKIWFPYKG